MYFRLNEITHIITLHNLQSGKYTKRSGLYPVMQKGNGVVDFNWHGPIELTIFVILSKIIYGYLAMPTKAWGLTYEEGMTMGIVSKITSLIKTTLCITLLTLALLRGTMYIGIYIYIYPFL